MPVDRPDIRKAFERGVAMLSLDTEQIWGYLEPTLDPLDEMQFQDRYPDAIRAHEKLLACLHGAGVSATWLVVGGMTLPCSEGAQDLRLAELPPDWIVKIPRGGEATRPLWYRQSFIAQLRAASPTQEIGLHAGLTHFIWTDARASRHVAKRELVEGIKALAGVDVQPRSFSFGRDEEAYHELLPEHGICVYRGRTPVLAYRLGRTLPGAMLRMLDEMRCATPPPVWPRETLPGLWNIPSSLFLYPIGPSRARLVALRTRVERVSRGLEAAARHRGIFHLSFHPENLTESPHGFSMFEEILERLLRARDCGDVEILTMGQAAARMSALHPPPNTHSQGRQTHDSNSPSHA